MIKRITIENCGSFVGKEDRIIVWGEWSIEHLDHKTSMGMVSPYPSRANAWSILWNPGFFDTSEGYNSFAEMFLDLENELDFYYIEFDQSKISSDAK